MAAALARVQAKHAAWNRGQLCGELADCLPASIADLEPAAAMALALDMANRIIAGEVQPVVCLDAPDRSMAPPVLRRDLDGRSVFTRPGVSRYATEVQLSREEKLLERARQEGAPRLTRARAARLLARAARAAGRAAARAGGRGRTRRAMQPWGLTAAQQAAAWHVLTSPRRCEVIEAPAGAGKTRVLAAARPHVHRGRDPGVRDRRRASRACTSCRAAAAQAGVDLTAWNTARLLGQRKDGTYRNPQEIAPGSVLLVDEGSMVSLEHYAPADEVRGGARRQSDHRRRPGPAERRGRRRRAGPAGQRAGRGPAARRAAVPRGLGEGGLAAAAGRRRRGAHRVRRPRPHHRRTAG